MVEREAARVVGRAAVLAERAAGGRDLVAHPGGPGPARVPVTVVARRGEAREHDHGIAGRVGRHVMDPAGLGLVEHRVAGLRGDRRAGQSAYVDAVRPLDHPAADTHVVQIHAGELVRMRVRVGHVNRVAAALRVLHVGALPRHEDEVARRRPRASAVVLDGVGRVVVGAPPEQEGPVLGLEADRVRVRVAVDSARVRGDCLRGAPGAHVARRRRHAQVHGGPHVARVEDDKPPVGAHMDRRVGVVVAVEARGQLGGHAFAGRVFVGADLDVALAVDPADVGHPLVRDRARIAEPRPGAVAERSHGCARCSGDSGHAGEHHERPEADPPQHASSVARMRALTRI